MIDCFENKNSAVTHSNPEDKPEVTLKWKAPEALKPGQKVDFKATVVKKADESYRLSNTITI